MSADSARLDGKLPKWERLDRAERFKARLAAAEQMQDTTQTGRYEDWEGRTFHGGQRPEPSAAEQFRAEAVARVDAVPTRDDLLNRIATLESEIVTLTASNARYASREYDLRYPLDLERHDRQQFRERIAAILATFYHAELSISSTQPIIALALELNPDLVERAR